MRESAVPPDPMRPQTAEEWRLQGERLLAAGSPILAYDSLAVGLDAFPGDVRLRQLLALSLARSGASRAAIPWLEGLRAEGHVDEETLGLLARVHKDLWADDRRSGQPDRHLQQAYEYYADAHRLSGGIWSGINAATVALLLGRRDEAARLAAVVRDACVRSEPADPSRASDYWHLATLGEAHLILGDWAQAEAIYARAAEIGRARIADTASTRRNARLIISAVGGDGAGVERSLRVPRVVAFAGHLIDRPDRAAPRFPPSLEAAAGKAIRERLARLDVGYGYASAASGADILFLESLFDMQVATTIVLPYDADQFEKDSVDLIPGADWPARYRRALARARDVITASERRMAGGQLSYEYVATLVDGLAGLRADALDTEAVPLVLWDGHDQGGRGGTAATVDQWRRGGRHVEVIDLSEIARAAGAPIEAALETSADAPIRGDDRVSVLDPQIVALLFADAKGFSGLAEEQIPAFVHRFLGRVAETLARASHPPILKNTWGDGLYFVFDSVRGAGLFALDLADAIRSTDWTRWGLPEHMSLRTGLHAGPAYACTDPVTGRPNYLGAHVSRTARIEPITPPGEVYASQEFAALARAEHVREFQCEYVGRTPLAKSYGTQPMFVVRRRAGPSGA